jgi:gas vesicle protein
MKSAGKIIAVFAAGAVVGGLLGLLFAPEKGSETRKKVADRGKKFSDAMKEKFSEAVKNGQQQEQPSI